MKNLSLSNQYFFKPPKSDFLNGYQSRTPSPTSRYGINAVRNKKINFDRKYSSNNVK